MSESQSRERRLLEHYIEQLKSELNALDKEIVDKEVELLALKGSRQQIATELKNRGVDPASFTLDGGEI